MKWSIAGLVVLGIVAAVSAALLMMLLMNGTALGPRANGTQDTEVIVAAKSIPSNTIVDGTMVRTAKLGKGKAPENSLGTSVDAIGKIIKSPMKEGELFNKDNFVTESVQQVAISLKPGERAVAVSLSDYAAIDGILYPGSIVDVVVTVNGNSGQNTKSVSKTVLEAVKVLGIEGQTIVAKADAKPEANERRGANARRVTLLVTSQEEVEVLQLAQSSGTLSLALRNPMDTKTSARAGMSMTSMLARQAAWLKSLSETSTASGAPAAPAVPAVASVVPEPAPIKPVVVATPKPSWETTIIRGGSKETIEFAPEPDTEKMVRGE